MRDVELGEDPRGTSGLVGPCPRPRTGRARLRWAAPVVVAALLALVAAQLYFDDRANRHVAELERVPGVLRSIDPPLRVSGTYPAGLWVPIVSGVPTSEALRVGPASPEPHPGATSSRDLVGVDPDTGRVAWRVPVDGPSAPIPSLASPVTLPALVSCFGLGDPATRVLCHVRPGGTPVLAPGAAGAGSRSDPAQAAATDAGAVQLLVRASDGRVEAARQVPGRSTEQLLHGVLVTAWVADDGLLRARGSDPVTDATRWSFVEDIEDRATPASTPDDGTIPTIVPGRDRILLTAGSRAWLLDRDGSSPRAVPSPTGLTAVRGDRLARVGATTQILDQEGQVISETPGTPAPVTVDDGSTPNLVFISGGSVEHPGTTVLTAVDATTGRVAWQSRVPATSSLVLLDSALYSVGDGILWALDAHTGTSRWSTPLGPDDGAGGLVLMFTDARHILLALPGDGTAGSLAAFNLSDGAHAWTTPLPAGIVQLSAADGRLVTTRDQDLLTLG